MKKKIILYLLLAIIIPVNTFAASISRTDISHTNATSPIAFNNGEYGYVTKYTYHATIDGKYQNLFCLDAGNLAAKYVNDKTDLNLSSSNYHRGLAAIYRMYLINGASDSDLTRASDAMRILTIRAGQKNGYFSCNENSIYNCWFLIGTNNQSSKTLTNIHLMSELSNLGAALSGNGTLNIPNNETLRKFYCAGAYAANLSDGSTSTCNNALSGINKDLLMLNNFAVNLTSTINADGTVTYKLNNSSFDTLFNDSTFSRLKSSSSIKVNSCSVDSASAAKGFSCELVGGNKNLINESQTIKINNSNLIVTDSEVTATINYTIHFPYDTSSLAILSCTGNDCTSMQQQGYSSYIPQRFIMVDKDKAASKSTNVKINVPSACKFEVNNGVASYKLNGKNVTELEYLTVGCCDVNPNYLKNQEAIIKYKNNCQAQDIVYFENECGTKSKLGRNVDSIDGTTVSTTTCSNETYVDYTKSYIWQLPMNKVMSRVSLLENGAYQNNLAGIYENEAIANNLDKSYMTSTITGKSGSILRPISSNNNYCMLYTSEENDLYFPGTAISTSGRYFVFDELDKQSCVNGTKNCYRQPFVTGKIDVTMHTNFTKWERDYLAAIEEEKAAYNTWASTNANADKQIYDSAKLKRSTLENYKTECESHNDINNYWTYNLSPTLDFTYKQKTYDGTGKTAEIADSVKMEISKEPVRYWPGKTTSATLVTGSSKGSRNFKTYNINYGNINETRTFDQTSNYSAEYKQTIYYRPKRVTYTTLASGRTILRDESYETTGYMMEDGILVGYVYEVKLNTYEGVYSTSFSIDNVGHLGLNNSSNVQKSLENYKKDNNLNALESQCVYCNQESQFKRRCDGCPDPNNPPLSANYIYRSVSLSNITPNDRANTNWSDAKGKAAEERIESLSGDTNINSRVSNNVSTTNEFKVVTLNETVSTKADTKLVASDYIYDDRDGYLEYDFTLTTKDLQMIRKNNTKNDYGTLNICPNNINSIAEKDADAEYCFRCNQDGKECASTFIDAFANKDVTAETRNNKWKYFVNGEWKVGSMASIPEFEDGRYPDPENQTDYLNENKNWP